MDIVPCHILAVPIEVLAISVECIAQLMQCPSTNAASCACLQLEPLIKSDQSALPCRDPQLQKDVGEPGQE